MSTQKSPNEIRKDNRYPSYLDEINYINEQLRKTPDPEVTWEDAIMITLIGMVGLGFIALMIWAWPVAIFVAIMAVCVVMVKKTALGRWVMKWFIS